GQRSLREIGDRSAHVDAPGAARLTLEAGHPGEQGKTGEGQALTSTRFSSLRRALCTGDLSSSSCCVGWPLRSSMKLVSLAASWLADTACAWACCSLLLGSALADAAGAASPALGCNVTAPDAMNLACSAAV